MGKGKLLTDDDKKNFRHFLLFLCVVLFIGVFVIYRAEFHHEIKSKSLSHEPYVIHSEVAHNRQDNFSIGAGGMTSQSVPKATDSTGGSSADTLATSINSGKNTSSISKALHPSVSVNEKIKSIKDKSDIEELVSGKLGFDVEDTMAVGTEYMAIVTVSKSTSERILYQGLDKKRFKDTIIPISSKVTVSLIDPSGNKNFNINPISTKEQHVDENANTIWMWNVEPIRGGNNELRLMATVKFQSHKDEAVKDIPVLSTKINVKSSYWLAVKLFISNYWQWITSALVIPFGLGLYNNLKTKRKDKESVVVTGFKIPSKRQ